MATVGLVETMYNVSEEEGNLTICINKSGSVSFPFNLTFTTTDGTASNVRHEYIIHYMQSL